jgi:hypothetical protein
MKPNLLLVVVAASYGAVGLLLTFAPREVLGLLGSGSVPSVAWLAQILGAAFFGLAFLNWLQRFTLLGGIYGRPLVIANLTFAVPAFFASLRETLEEPVPLLLAATLGFGLIAAVFAYRLFRPTPGEKAIRP